MAIILPKMVVVVVTMTMIMVLVMIARRHNGLLWN
jgi:hypothetical protein